jgi:uncharacterized protein YbjT (DUF2867 family)
MPTVLVTGSTGTVGSRTVERLASTPGVTVRAGVHSRPLREHRDNVVPVEIDYEKADTLRAAAEGVDSAFLITPAVPNQPELAERALEALQGARVPRLVRLSVLGADRSNPRMFQRAHAQTEQQIQSAGISHTFLRPNSYMSELFGLFAPDAEGNLRLPWGNAGVSHVDPGDIASVATHVLTTDGHNGKAYTLTGPEAIATSQVASDISEVSGRKVQYIDTPEDAMRQGMLAAGLPSMLVDFLMDLHASYRVGEMALVNDNVLQLTGRSATTFKAFARAHAENWKIA